EHRVVSIIDESESRGKQIPPEETRKDRPSMPTERPAPPSPVAASLPPRGPQPTPSIKGSDISAPEELSNSSLGSHDKDLPFAQYSVYVGPPELDPRSVELEAVSKGIVRIVETEGPVVAKRVYDTYLRGCDIRRMGHDLKATMNDALALAIRNGLLISENETNNEDLAYSVVRGKGSQPICVRTRGPREFEEIPPSELQMVAKYVAKQQGFVSGSEEHLRAVLELYDLKRLTTQVSSTMLDILERRFLHVDEAINRGNW
ncbi:MAG: hypothetical protein WCQ50_19440, partial [Spirochaetota bacterium]